MATPDNPLDGISGFEWDEGNALKNWERHRVSQAEAEETFFLRPVLLVEDDKHSESEPRFALFGRTSADRLLTIIFTIRGSKVRVISARPMSRKERLAHAKAPPEEP